MLRNVLIVDAIHFSSLQSQTESPVSNRVPWDVWPFGCPDWYWAVLEC